MGYRMGYRSEKDTIVELRKELLTMAQLILEQKIDIIEGCQAIPFLWHQAGLPLNSSYNFFVCIGSETDTYPTEEMRERCSEKYLREKDKEKEEYLEECWPQIKEECLQLIERLS